MYLSQTNGPAYARVVGSLGLNILPFNTSPWLQDYNCDYAFAGDSPMGFNPTLVSDPMLIADMASLPSIYGQNSAEPNYFKLERPQKVSWSSDTDFHRYGTYLDVVNQITRSNRNLDMPRENEVLHRHYSGTVRDTDTPFFDFHTGSQHGIWAANVATYDIVYPDSVAIRELQAIDINSDGYLVFQGRASVSDEPGSSAIPSTDYWDHTRRVVSNIQENGFYAVNPDYGNWPSETIWPDGAHLLVWKSCVDKSHRDSNFWHFDISYVYEKKYHERGKEDLWVTSFDVHIDFTARFNPSRGSNNPFDWNSIPDDLFTIVDHSTVSVRSSDLDYFGYHYSRWPVDEVSPPRDIYCVWPGFHTTYHPILFSSISQSSVGERSRLRRLITYETPQRDPLAYLKGVYQTVDHFFGDFRAASFYSSSDALHKQIDVLQSNNIENATQLSGILELIPDLPALSRVVAKAAKRDPSAILEAVDIIADAVLAFRFGQKPTVDDAMELAKTNVVKEVKGLLHVSEATLYGQYHYLLTDSDMARMSLPGSIRIVTRSKIRIHTDMTTLLAGYLTANGVGLMPTLSRLWAVVPFSFVVDWFTGMGDRLQAVDDQLLWMAMGTSWCLHSFKITYYPPKSEFDRFGLESDLDDPFGVTFYKREFSRLMPRLSESRFDYLAPDHGPQPVTVGALVWQFI